MKHLGYDCLTKFQMQAEGMCENGIKCKKIKVISESHEGSNANHHLTLNVMLKR